MSLHLIESTKAPARTPRKRGGATASVILHATLVVSAFAAASAAPVVKEPRTETDLIYVAPTPPPAPQRTAKVPTNTAANAPVSPTQFVVPSMPEISTIPVDIPPITFDMTMDFTSARDFSRRSSDKEGGTGVGTGDNVGATTTPSGSVLSDREVDRQVTILSGYRTPRYPEMLRATGVEETLMATFVVDTLGRVEAGSLEVPNAQHTPFVAAVREALANARFRPAESQGRRVRQRVMQAFVFSLSRN